MSLDRAYVVLFDKRDDGIDSRMRFDEIRAAFPGAELHSVLDLWHRHQAEVGGSLEHWPAWLAAYVGAGIAPWGDRSRQVGMRNGQALYLFARRAAAFAFLGPGRHFRAVTSVHPRPTEDFAPWAYTLQGE